MYKMVGLGGFSDLSRNPLGFIGIVISIILISKVATVALPLVITEFLALAGLANFSFGALFADDAVGEIIIGALILIAILGALGVKKLGGSSR